MFERLDSVLLCVSASLWTAWRSPSPSDTNLLSTLCTKLLASKVCRAVSSDRVRVPYYAAMKTSSPAEELWFSRKRIRTRAGRPPGPPRPRGKAINQNVIKRRVGAAPPTKKSSLTGMGLYRWASHPLLNQIHQSINQSTNQTNRKSFCVLNVKRMHMTENMNQYENSYKCCRKMQIKSNDIYKKHSSCFKQLKVG